MEVVMQWLNFWTTDQKQILLGITCRAESTEVWVHAGFRALQIFLFEHESGPGGERPPGSAAASPPDDGPSRLRHPGAGILPGGARRLRAGWFVRVGSGRAAVVWPRRPAPEQLPAPGPTGRRGAALRNDLGSNISWLKTLNLRFRCFLVKVHELERRNKVLEKQLQQALEDNSGGDPHQKPLTKDMGVQSGFIGPIHPRPGYMPHHNANNPAYLTGGLLSPTLNPPPLFHNKYLLGNNLNTDSNSNLTTSPALSPSDPTRTISNINEKLSAHTGTRTSNGPPPPRFLPGTIWSFNHTRRFGTGRESCVTGPGVSWTHPDGVGVQIDTITPEIRALNNVLAKVKRERDEYKRR
ncbi:non-homologous end joining factor IFFO1-like [Amphiprion ocellaris]|uniref:non-homologous end joining factor IFFO1-like n=1 Tax=Amphiprion ocellaris TaxID=80972 RepID=UPI002410C367|nr:non-homologous end joining factor IFFO1-like [Amphiprion ocellaris]